MLVLATSPGPGAFAIVASALSQGYRKTVPMICGIVMGDVAFLLLSVFGLSVVASALGDLFYLVRIGGGIYIIILGLKLILQKPQPTIDDHTFSPHRLSGFVSGLAITLSNPKVILFYCGFLPTFLDLSRMTTSDLSVITIIVAIVLSSVMSFYALMASRARRFFKQPRSLRHLNQAAGGMMATVGAILIFRS